MLLKNNVKLEYVSSALISRLTTPYTDMDVDWLSGATKQLGKDARFSILYNAFQEKKDGEYLTRLSSETPIYADSGGLQMVTTYTSSTKIINGVNTKVYKKHSQTPEMRQKVYDSQIQSCNFAMSFDVLPKITVMRGTDIEVEPWFKGKTSKIYIQSKHLESAHESKNNLKEQIDYFRNKNVDTNKTKIIAIAQGHSLQSFQEWMDILLEGLTEEELSYLGGVAIGFAGLRNVEGIIGDIRKFFIASKLQLPDSLKSHYHHLGVGAVIRLIPLIPFVNNGSYKDCVISYDSSTHSSWVNYGHWLKADGTRYSTLNKTANPRGVFREMYDTFEQNIFESGLSFDDFEKVSMYGNSLKNLQHYNISKQTMNKAMIMYIYSAIYNHNKLTHRCFTDPGFLEQFTEEYFSTRIKSKVDVAYALKQLEKVNDEKDFSEWEYSYHKFMTKMPAHIAQHANDTSHSLEDLFSAT